MAKNRIIIIGFGGFARELAWLIRDISRHSPSADVECTGHVISDLKADAAGPGLLGDFNWLQENRRSWDSFAIGVGTPAIRALLFRDLSEKFPDADWPALVHPSVRYEASSAKMGRGTIVCANTIGTVNLIFQDACLVNLSCTIGHEAEIGMGTVINPSVNISGGVKIGNRALLGTGAQVLQYLTIGDDANVGAGAVVTKDVQANTTVVGIPAKILAPR